MKASGLFFTANGCGPDPVDFRLKPMEPMIVDGETICARTIGLMVSPAKGGLGFMIWGEAGGYQLAEADVRELRDAFSAWLESSS